MYRIGIDVGSTYTKYCVMKDRKIITLFSEKTPIRQKKYFDNKVIQLSEQYPGARIISCGYGKANVDGIKTINELTALARGAFFCTSENGCVLDIGGQDSKIITQMRGQLKDFYVNDKCAAGSGMFLASILEMIHCKYEDINVSEIKNVSTRINSTCAVFAQSEIVEMIADNRTEKEILYAVLIHILTKVKSLVQKTESASVLLSGGLSEIKGIELLASDILGKKCSTVNNGIFFASIGCADIESED